MRVLETKNLSKKYKGVYAVEKVNMHIDEGDIYGFVGENGAGKTTIIRLITGLANQSEGSYSLFGIDCNDKNIYGIKKDLGAIVEAPTINKSFTALDNLKYQNMITKNNKTDNELKDIIKSVGLDYEKIKTRKAGNFSLGMRQRLGIAIILVSDPKFIILDEPMNGLDPEGIIEVRETILRLNKKGITFLISSHILAELDKVCTKIGIISKGKLIEEISINELHNKSRRKTVINLVNNEDINNLINLLALKDYTIEENTLIVFDEVDINSIMKVLVEGEIKIKGIDNVEETIESYYIKLLSGERK